MFLTVLYFLGHCYALQLGSHRVWDYKGDNFVHRLLQNKADGKLVPAGEERVSDGTPPSVDDPSVRDKVDSVQLEFTYLLTSQLDTQRQYFEERLSRVEEAACAEAELLRERNDELIKQIQKLEAVIEAAEKERQAAERKVAQLSQRLSVAHSELADERQLGTALRANQVDWQQRQTKLETKLLNLRTEKDREIEELRDQIRDLMFYIDAGKKIADSADRDDIAGGTVTVGPPASTEQNDNYKQRRGGRKRQ